MTKEFTKLLEGKKLLYVKLPKHDKLLQLPDLLVFLISFIRKFVLTKFVLNNFFTLIFGRAQTQNQSYIFRNFLCPTFFMSFHIYIYIYTYILA